MIKILLEKMSKPILCVDHGCENCIENLTDAINEILQSMDIPYRYVFTGETNHSSYTLTVVDQNNTN